jgi:hypothetical protein
VPVGQQPPQPEADHQQAAHDGDDRVGDDRAGGGDEAGDDGDRCEVAERDRRQRRQQRAAAAHLHAAGDREEPAHRRVDAMEDTECE